MKVLGRFSLLLIIAFSSCKKDSETTITEYLGQTPPGETPLRFAPSSSYRPNSIWWWIASPSFSPDGKEMYFGKYIRSNSDHEIWFTKCVNGEWSEPQKAPFSSTTFDSNPRFFGNNDELFFFSQRSDGFIFKVTRIASGWSEPSALNIPLPANMHGGQAYSIANNGNVYCVLWDEDYRSCDIYRSKFENGQYLIPENLGTTVNCSGIDGVEYVDPNEQFIVFSSVRPQGSGFHDLYKSNRNQDGTWSTPMSLGPQINSSQEDVSANLSPDGKYLFFISIRTGDVDYTAYWVDAGILK